MTIENLGMPSMTSDVGPDLMVGTGRDGRCVVGLTMTRKPPAPGMQPYECREEMRLQRADVEWLVRELTAWLKRVS